MSAKIVFFGVVPVSPKRKNCAPLKGFYLVICWFCRFVFEEEKKKFKIFEEETLLLNKKTKKQKNKKTKKQVNEIKRVKKNTIFMSFLSKKNITKGMKSIITHFESIFKRKEEKRERKKRKKKEKKEKNGDWFEGREREGGERGREGKKGEKHKDRVKKT